MRTFATVAIAVLAAAGLAACGGSGGSKAEAPASAPPATRAAATASTPVATMSKTKVGEVLVTGQGLTLYHLATEKGGRIACTGGCAATWPPLTVTGRGPFKVKGGAALTLVKRPDGTEQLAYRGQPLYRYAGDHSSADANGQGIAGTWFAVTAKASSGAARPAPTPKPATTSSGYYPNY